MRVCGRSFISHSFSHLSTDFHCLGNYHHQHRHIQQLFVNILWSFNPRLLCALVKLIKFGISTRTHTVNVGKDWEHENLFFDTVMRTSIFPRHWSPKKEREFLSLLLFLSAQFCATNSSGGKDNAKWIEDSPSSGKSKSDEDSLS